LRLVEGVQDDQYTHIGQTLAIEGRALLRVRGNLLRRHAERAQEPIQHLDRRTWLVALGIASTTTARITDVVAAPTGSYRLPKYIADASSSPANPLSPTQ
jgi:hypothetical protein